MALFSKRSATVTVILLMLGMAVAQAREMGLQSCLPANNGYGGATGLRDWTVSIGRIGEKTSMLCHKTAYNVRLCCESETRTTFKRCEPADESGDFPKCWGNKGVVACCTPSK